MGRTITIDEDEDLLTAAKEMSKHDVGCLVVLGENRKVVGIITERDFIMKVAAEGVTPSERRVADIMTTNVVFCSMDTPIAKVRQLMASHHVRHLPVMEDDVPMGMVSSRDILAHELSQTQALASHQSDILHRIEQEHPEVVHWRRDSAGRIVIP